LAAEPEEPADFQNDATWHLNDAASKQNLNLTKSQSKALRLQPFFSGFGIAVA
jgi:hypothetical protein